ncbi:hypothetical protein BC830DRAFT_764002 [Chytriomyces sp. MP71]|nr:hypothetical protein BC830DRAFT_764002 [Chytriomyces sp. MP71]
MMPDMCAKASTGKLAALTPSVEGYFLTAEAVALGTAAWDVKCPGAPNPSSAPSCGGSEMAFSVYTAAGTSVLVPVKQAERVSSFDATQVATENTSIQPLDALNKRTILSAAASQDMSPSTAPTSPVKSITAPTASSDPSNEVFPTFKLNSITAPSPTNVSTTTFTSKMYPVAPANPAIQTAPQVLQPLSFNNNNATGAATGAISAELLVTLVVGFAVSGICRARGASEDGRAPHRYKIEDG